MAAGPVVLPSAFDPKGEVGLGAEGSDFDGAGFDDAEGGAIAVEGEEIGKSRQGLGLRRGWKARKPGLDFFLVELIFRTPKGREGAKRREGSG